MFVLMSLNSAFAVCTSRWEAYSSVQYLGLTNININTVNECRTFCQNRLPNICETMDFDVTQNPPCFVQTIPGLKIFIKLN